MLNFSGKGSAHTCDGINRRDFLQVGTSGGGGDFSLADLQRLQASEGGRRQRQRMTSAR